MAPYQHAHQTKGANKFKSAYCPPIEMEGSRRTNERGRKVILTYRRKRLHATFYSVLYHMYVLCLYTYIKRERERESDDSYSYWMRSATSNKRKYRIARIALNERHGTRAACACVWMGGSESVVERRAKLNYTYTHMKCAHTGNIKRQQ